MKRNTWAGRRSQREITRKPAKNAKPVQSAGHSPHRQTRAIQQAIDLALQHHTAGRLPQAERIYRQVLQSERNHPVALHMLGVVALHAKKHGIAVDLIKKALTITPENADAHYNLGLTLSELGKLEEAVASYRKALAIRPDYAKAHNNLCNTLQALGKSEEAVASGHKALAIKPDYAEAHNNLGNALQDLGKLDEAVASYLKALAIKPDYAEAWRNFMFAAKALLFSQAREDGRDDPSKAGLSPAARAATGFAMFEYYLDGFRPHEAGESARKATAALPARTDEEITVSGTGHKAANLRELPDKLVALLHFGRSGTGLLHSLIDGHPEISTLPSIYLRGFFNSGVWNRIAAGGWRRLPGRFADEFAVLFDANSPNPVPSIPGEASSYIGRKEGMTAVGENRDEVLSLDRDRFCSEALRLMESLEKVDPGSFLMVIHAAFEKALGTKSKKQTVFYHIHNPDIFAKLNFLRYVPNARLVMMVREPIQSCESWIHPGFEGNDYKEIVPRIISMLFAFDQIAFRTQVSVGVRLEDLKTRLEATMRGLCAWLGVGEAPALYQMTAQGKKWWGESSSPDYQEGKGMSLFEDAPIKRPVGMVFSEKDQLVLRTLFYPFSVRFGYMEPDQAGFEKNLKEIRPLLDDMLDFEKVISERSQIDPVQFKRSGSYLLLRAGFLDRWDVLNEFKDYPHMLPPLDVAPE